jgi:hypothetical protein
MKQFTSHATAWRGETIACSARRAFATLVVASSLLPAASFAQSTLNYTTSWIGNTFGFGDGKWVQLDIQAMAVGQDGTIYTNAPWDESGSEIGAYKGGSKVGYADSTHGWGNTGGDSIAVNGSYLYAGMSIGNEGGKLVGSGYPANGSTWFGITRRTIANITKGASFQGGVGNLNNPTANSFLVLNVVPTGTDAAIRGLAATSTALYVANTYANQIQVFDANTMAAVSSWGVPSPGRIAIDADGSLWIIQNLQSASGRAVAHYSATGTALPGTVTLPNGAVPVDLTVSPSGQLLIADGGPSQQILVYSKTASGIVTLDTGVGAQGGIFAGTPGVPGDWRFNGMTGIGFDGNGNLYVSQNNEGPRGFGSTGTGQGAVLESYNWSSKALNWRLHGLLFVDGAAIDSGSPNDVFSGSKHFSLNYAAGPGQEWSYVGFTLNRIRYPDDPALHLTRGVRGQPLVRPDQWCALPLHTGHVCALPEHLSVQPDDGRRSGDSIRSAFPEPGTGQLAHGATDVRRMDVEGFQWRRTGAIERDPVE